MATSFLGRRAGEKRTELRNALWPNSESIIYNFGKEKGYCSIPRTLPLIMTLINELTDKKKGDASRVYLELWSRAFEEGIVTITDEESHAFSSGYTEQGRGLRSWRERLDILKNLGFIDIKPVGLRKNGHILLHHPHDVVDKLHDEKKISEAWWNMYIGRLNEIRAKRRNKQETEKTAPVLRHRKKG